MERAEARPRVVLPLRRPRRRASRRNLIIAGAMLAPAAVLSLGLLAYAIGLEAWFSVSDAGPGTNGTYVGLANFQYLAGLDSFWQTVANTGIYTGVSTLLKLALGLVMALALARP